MLLAAFLITESRAAQPITPLRLFADRGRSGSYLVRLLLVAGMFGMFFFLTQFLQEVLGFSPLRAGVAFLPMTAALFTVSRLAPRLVPRFGPKPLMVAGLLPVVAGMAWLAQISAGDHLHVRHPRARCCCSAPGWASPSCRSPWPRCPGWHRRTPGAASSMVNVMQQIGGALGLAILVTVFGTAYRHAAAAGTAAHGVAVKNRALVHGVAAAFSVAAVFDGCALLVILLTTGALSRRR